MKTILLSNPVQLKDLTGKYHIEDFTLVRSSIGYDGCVYFLFAQHVPERIHGMFVDTRANTGYAVIRGIVDWTDERLISDEFIDLGVHEMNYHMIQPIDHDILLLGARAGLQKNGAYENNACIVNTQGEVLDAFCLGDGIEDCIVTKDGRIITGYFDEGVFGDSLYGSKGLVIWNRSGQPIWLNEKYDIYDCYAMNIDEQENLWFYFYSDFDLVRTDFQKDLVYHPEVSGMNKFLLTKGNQLMCDGGYNKHGQFCKMDILHDRLENVETVNIEFEGKVLLLKDAVFRSSKAVFRDNEDRFYFKDVVWI